MYTPCIYGNKLCAKVKYSVYPTVCPSDQLMKKVWKTSGAVLTHDTLIAPWQSFPAWTAVGMETRSTHIWSVRQLRNAV